MQQMTKIQELRRLLHRNAELSGREYKTEQIIRRFIGQGNADEMVTNLGGLGLAAVFSGTKPGPTVLIRGDMDALPIDETIAVDYASEQQGVSHKCGHDGHMAILAALALRLQLQRPQRGRVILLFQPAEETGQGAKEVIADPKFAKLTPDYVFALHNLPGYPLGKIILRKGVFASASQGLIVNLQGISAHASEPQLGKSPALAVAQLIHNLSALPQLETALHSAAQVTVIHAQLGEVAFGTSPDKALVMATLRSHRQQVMERLAQRSVELAGAIATTYQLQHSIDWVEKFPATVNDDEAIQLIEAAAASAGLSTCQAPVPFPWSEDFGHFTAISRGALFGLGAGETTASIHHPHYDFPDQLLASGANIFASLIAKILG